MRNISLILALFLVTLTSCNKEVKNEVNVAPNKVLSDIEMVDYFEVNKVDFETLHKWITEDKLEFMMLNSSDARHLDKISKERADAYFKLMEKLDIPIIARGNALNFNSVVFYFPSVSQSEGMINKGYEYKIDLTKINKGWIKTDNELLVEANSHERNTFLYKPIDQHWSLICLIQ